MRPVAVDAQARRAQRAGPASGSGSLSPALLPARKCSSWRRVRTAPAASQGAAEQEEETREGPGAARHDGPSGAGVGMHAVTHSPPWAPAWLPGGQVVVNDPG